MGDDGSLVPMEQVSKTHALSEQGLHAKHVTAGWQLVRAMEPHELARVRLAIRHLPQKASQLLGYLDPSKRLSPVDCAEQWAQEILREAVEIEADLIEW